MRVIVANLYQNCSENLVKLALLVPTSIATVYSATINTQSHELSLSAYAAI